MNSTDQDFTRQKFAKTFVLPALLIFVLPALALLFFLHAQSRHDADARNDILRQIQADRRLSEQERAAAIQFFTDTPVSQLVQNELYAANFHPTTKFHYATFRWMIRLSVLSIAGGVVVFFLAGLCVWLSLRSQFAQYVSLLVSWHVLRIYGALQTVVMAILLVALSFWVTALWFEFYVVQLIAIMGLLCAVAVGAVIKAIFKNPVTDLAVAGAVVNRQNAAPFWDALNAVCAKVGVPAPDHVVAGIDDNFFVTEHLMTVNGDELRGKSLFVSLPLLKQLHAAEAEAVLAHELAHFSGNDTLYSRRISPLLQRYDHYLQGLHDGKISWPVFQFMLCFRVLFELSLNRLRRQREFRADGIAAATISPTDFAGALLKIAAYSRFRNSVQTELFQQDQLLETADVSARVERGFRTFAVEFASHPDLGGLETAHPFDSHPPLSQRLAAVGVPLETDLAQALLSTPGDGGWYYNLPAAAELELQQWQAFEEMFRQQHEHSLPYRFLPETEAERLLVERVFPPRTLPVEGGTLALDCEKIQPTFWADAVYFRELTHCLYNERGELEVHYQRDGARCRAIPTKQLTVEARQELLQTFEQYYNRYLAAAEYQQHAKAQRANDWWAQAPGVNGDQASGV